MKTRDLLTGRIATLSNALSLLRIGLIPFFWYYLHHEHSSGNPTFMYSALIVLVLIALTDFLDGFLARTLNQVSRLGQFLDPLSDKITVFACGIILFFYREFPLWVVVTVFVRDLLMLSGGYLLFTKKDIQARPNIYGKYMIISLFLSGIVYVYRPATVFSGISLQHISIVFIGLFLITSTITAFRSYSRIYHSTPTS